MREHSRFLPTGTVVTVSFCVIRAYGRLPDFQTLDLDLAIGLFYNQIC